jgi:hypothetical protein
MAFKILVVGAGAQGKVISTWLSRWPEAEEVKLADIGTISRKSTFA